MTWRRDHNRREGVAGGGNVGDGRRRGDGLGCGEEPDLADLRVADSSRRSPPWVHFGVLDLIRETKKEKNGG